MGIKSRLSSFKKGFVNIFKCSGGFKTKKLKQVKRKSTEFEGNLETIKEDSVSAAVSSPVALESQAEAPQGSTKSEIITQFEQFINQYRWGVYNLECALYRKVFPYGKPSTDKEFLDCIAPVVEVLFALGIEGAELHRSYRYGNEAEQEKKFKEFHQFLNYIACGGEVPKVYSHSKIIRTLYANEPNNLVVQEENKCEGSSSKNPTGDM